MKRISLIAASGILASCTNFSPPYSHQELVSGQTYWLSYDASRRGALVVSGNSTIKSCAEPAPDVALSFANTLKGDFKAPGNISGTGVDAAANATAVALAGRNDVVLLAREALFRICEASLNGTIDASRVSPLFQDVFEQVKLIAEAQARDSANKAHVAEAQLKILELSQ